MKYFVTFILLLVNTSVKPQTKSVITETKKTLINLRGIVLDKSTGKGIGGASVKVVSSPGPGHFPVNFSTFNLVSLFDGKFFLSNIPFATNITLSVSAIGYHTFSKQIPFSPKEGHQLFVNKRDTVKLEPQLSSFSKNTLQVYRNKEFLIAH